MKRYLSNAGHPDHDPTNPYHYHDSEGRKIIITPEDWERYKDDPVFKNIRNAVEAERAAYPNPEYEVDSDFIRDLRTTYSGNMGYNYQNYKNFGNSLPNGYSFTPEGIIIGPDGTPYVQAGYRETPRFKYNIDNPFVFTINKGKSIERTLTYYPINVDKKLKTPLSVDEVRDITKEKEDLIENYNTEKEEFIQKYINDNKSSENITKYRYPYSVFTYGKNTKRNGQNVYVWVDKDGGWITGNNINDIPYVTKEDIINSKNWREKHKKEGDGFYNVIKREINNNPIDFEEEQIIINNTKIPTRKEAEKKAIEAIGPINRRTLVNGWSIYIKPSHRGRFTALKERTGHSATWFKENGTPAQKKMATFALNAAKWKH